MRVGYGSNSKLCMSVKVFLRLHQQSTVFYTSLFVVAVVSVQSVQKSSSSVQLNPRTPQDMDGTLPLIFAKLETS